MLQATKDYYQALCLLNDRYLFENMTNKEYLNHRKAIRIAYLKALYNKKQ